MSDPARYPIQIFWSEEDEGYIATAPDLPGSSAFGTTQEEAAAEIFPAIEAWIEAAMAAGNPVPEPSLPVTDTAFSGKVLLRMPQSLHGRLSGFAKGENVSLNQYIVYVLSLHCGNQRADIQSSAKPRSTQLTSMGSLREPIIPGSSQ